MITVLQANFFEMFRQINVEKLFVDFVIFFRQVGRYVDCLIKIIVAEIIVVITARVVFIARKICADRISNNFDNLLNRVLDFGANNVLVAPVRIVVTA